MTGWNPRDPSVNKEIITVVNEYWWKGYFKRATKTTQVICSLAREVLSLRGSNKQNQEQKEFLFSLLKELARFPIEHSQKAALGDETDANNAFNEYVSHVLSISNKRLDIFIDKDAHEFIASV